MMDTMSPMARGLIPTEHQLRINSAGVARTAAEIRLRNAVLDAARAGASVRELAKFTGLSTNTISRWKRDDK